MDKDFIRPKLMKELYECLKDYQGLCCEIFANGNNPELNKDFAVLEGKIQVYQHILDTYY